MEITEITITLRNEDKVKALVNLTFDNQFVVRGMKVIKGANGYFVSMPSRKTPDGSFRDISRPIENEFRQSIEKAILAEFNKQLKEKETQNITELSPESSFDDPILLEDIRQGNILDEDHEAEELPLKKIKTKKETIWQKTIDFIAKR